jgi:phage-related tail fiber protein
LSDSSFPPSNSAILLNVGSSIKEGDTNANFQIKLTDETGQPIDLTGSTVKVYFSRADDTFLFEKDAVLSTTPTDGTISFKFLSSDITGSGIINIQINVTYSGSTIEKFPANDFIKIYVDESNDNLTNFSSVSFNTFNDVKNEIQESALTSIVSIHQELNDEDQTLQTNIDTVQSNLTAHTSNTSNPHNVTKSQVGLSNVDNTSDVNKPISTATQTALDAKVDDSQVVTTPTANKILQLDTNGDFPTDITGNSATSTKLQIARTIAASGDVTGTETSFDGSSNITIPLTLASSGVTSGTYKSVTVDSKGRVTAGTNPTTLSGYGITDAVNISDVVTTATASKILKLDSNSKLPASITGNADGNAVTATKLQTSRTIGASGDAIGTATSFDGSANITIPLSLSTSGVTAGTYKSVTVDTKGRVTAGTNPTTISGYGITDALLSSSYTASDVLTKIKTVDGSGSGLDADTVDGMDSSVLVTKYTTQIGDGSATSYVITHNLNTQNCFISIRAVASPYEIVTPSTIQMTTVNTITITFASAPTTNQYQVTVIG